MTKIDIFSGFLGAGKTTLIKKLINEAYKGEKLVLIENEFGEIGIDGGFLQDAGIVVNEMNSGCICCSLVGDFGEALKKVISEYSPDRILIEPSGVGKLSDVKKAVSDAKADGACLNSYTTVCDAKKCKMYMKNFGEFFGDQIENAGCIILSHTDNMSEEKLSEAVNLVKEHNKEAVIVTTPWDELTGEQIVMAMEKSDTLENDIKNMHEHHHEHGEDCCCGHHEHHHDEHCDCGHHEHHHEHDEHCDCGHHEHHHDHDEHCDCGCHEHHHDHHHHHADEVFTSFGVETANKYTKEEILSALNELSNEEKYGIILRAKGILSSSESEKWIHFDYVPGEPDVRDGSSAVIGRLCIIGSKINEEALKNLFRL